MPLTCTECEAQLRVTITGGEYLVMSESTPDNINFEAAPSRAIVTLDESEDVSEDNIKDLDVIVECSANPCHLIFANTITDIKRDIFARIQFAATQFVHKYS